MPFFLETLIGDLRLSLRRFRHQPAFTITALLALTLGIGPATAVFSVVDRILFRGLAYPHGEQLLSIGMVAPLIHAQDWLFYGSYQE